jgi:hypothetical protein
MAGSKASREARKAKLRRMRQEIPNEKRKERG